MFSSSPSSLSLIRTKFHYYLFYRTSHYRLFTTTNSNQTKYYYPNNSKQLLISSDLISWKRYFSSGLNPNTTPDVDTTTTHHQRSSDQYEPVIGLEVHAQLLTKSKLFSTANSEFVARPNSQVSYFDRSLPGTLPVLNRRCVELAIKTGLALNCTIPFKSTFDRKHYFYGDMPNGYQITQQREPIASGGFVDFIVYDEYYYNKNRGSIPTGIVKPYMKRCHLKQIQLEQDSGKSLCDTEGNQNLIDLNRAGTALIELVFEPDLRSPLEATSLIRELIQILFAIEACSCKMEEGALRIDANVSIRPRSDQSNLGTRTEIKNLNSLRHMREAINYEIERQSDILGNNKNDGKVINETMGYDTRSRKTYAMRDKEIVQDYRFMPEPNLPPILLTSDNSDRCRHSFTSLLNITEIDRSLPRHLLSQTIRDKFLQKSYQLTLLEIFFLQNNRKLCNIFEEIFSHSTRKNGSEIVQFLLQFVQIGEEGFMVELDRRPELEQIVRKIQDPKWLAELIDLRFDQRISPQTSIDLINLCLQQESSKKLDKNPSELIDQFNWWLIKDPEQIELVCRNVVEMLPKVARNFAKSGKRKKHSQLIQKAMAAMDNQISEEELWKVYEKILRNKVK